MKEYCLKVCLVNELKLVTTGGRSGKLHRFKNPHDAIDFVYENNIQEKVHVVLMNDNDYYDFKSVSLKTLQKSNYNADYGIWESK